jgi:hypothetical protein
VKRAIGFRLVQGRYAPPGRVRGFGAAGAFGGLRNRVDSPIVTFTALIAVGDLPGARRSVPDALSVEHTAGHGETSKEKNGIRTLKRLATLLHWTIRDIRDMRIVIRSLT